MSQEAMKKAAEMFPADKLPPRPWKHAVLMIMDANDNEVFHLGGQTDRAGRTRDPYWLTALVGLIVKCVNPIKLNAMFHFEGGQLIKTSNGQAVPEDEPLFILRGRDALAAPTIFHYIKLMQERGDVPSDRKTAVLESLEEFRAFTEKNPERMKLPGITHGK